jgi:uncharacterized Zn finger protein (UPF0148 family)
MDSEHSAECPSCGSGNIRFTQGGAVSCVKCGAALTEVAEYQKDDRGKVVDVATLAEAEPTFHANISRSH